MIVQSEASYRTPNETLEEKMIRREMLRQQYMHTFPKYRIRPEDMEAVFVLSTGKCGTFTMQALLTMSEDIFALHEPMPRLWHYCNRAFWQAGRVEDGSIDVMVRSARQELLEVVNSYGYLYAECAHRLSVYCHALKRQFPLARFIFLVRAMDAVVESSFNWGIYHPNDRYAEGRVRPQEHTTWTQSQKLAWYWCALNEFVIDFLETLPREDWHFVGFDTLSSPFFKGPDLEALRRLYQWLGAEVPGDQELNMICAARMNSQKNKEAVEKDWHDFDLRAEAIYEWIGENTK